MKPKQLKTNPSQKLIPNPLSAYSNNTGDIQASRMQPAYGRLLVTLKAKLRFGPTNQSVMKATWVKIMETMPNPYIILPIIMRWKAPLLCT